MGAAFSVVRRAFVGWYDSMLSLVLLNLLWLLALVTIVLLPPATAAMYAVANDIAHGESSGFTEFIQAGRRYFVKSWVWALINVVVLTLTWVNIVFYGQQGTDLAIIVQAIFVILGIYWLVIQFYFWPYIMEQTDQRVVLALRNSVLTALATPGFTLLIVLFVTIIIILSLVFVLPTGVMTTAVIALLGNYAVIDRLVAFGKIRAPGADTDAQPEE